MTSVSDLMKAGDTALNRGDTEKALSYFSSASLVADDHRDKARAEQSAGICLRLLKQFEDAKAVFGIAYGYAEDDLLRGRIKRDWGMVFLDEGQADKAMELFEESRHLILSIGLDHPDKNKAHIEDYVTLGFIGRAYLVLGDKESARMHMKSADDELRGHEPYELNNLVWRMKVSPPLIRRKLLFPRAWRLAREAGHRKRQLQILLLAASPTLAHFVEKRMS